MQRNIRFKLILKKLKIRNISLTCKFIEKYTIYNNKTHW